jgi:F-type H+-transporting ATPase subunit b
MANLIDIKLVGTQILGFLIMVWILGKFAWGPIVAGLEERRRKIAGEFAEAERRKHEAEELKAKYDAELRGIDAVRRQSIQEGIAEGQRVAAEIKVHANEEAQARLHRAADEMAREHEKAKELLKEQVVALSIRTAEKILQSKLDDPAQRRLAAAFIDEVGGVR